MQIIENELEMPNFQKKQLQRDRVHHATHYPTGKVCPIELLIYDLPFFEWKTQKSPFIGLKGHITGIVLFNQR
ncbi:hypothetical protein DBR40_24730 [Pedobacter sp. KBW01]|nr:hypothetical protein DBR40_24730 [Pedobacter sp. KBW01]